MKKIFFLILSLCGISVFAASVDWVDPKTGQTFRYIGNYNQKTADVQCKNQGMYWKLPLSKDVNIAQADRISRAPEFTDYLLIEGPTTGDPLKAFWTGTTNYVYYRTEYDPMVLAYFYTYRVFPVVCLYAPFREE